MIRKLSKREQEIYNLLVFENVDISDVAKICNLSKSTIKTYLSNIYNKLGIGSLAEMIRQHYRGDKG